MYVIITFFLLHWFLSLFFHSFFLHRYASHRQYTVTKNWERFFYLSTWFTQGSSYLVPSAYGVLHRMHHEYSDTEHDPHSPHFFRDIWQMMIHTAAVFRDLQNGQNPPKPKFTREYLPAWRRLDKIGNSSVTRTIFALGYLTVYIVFAPSAWWFLLLPIHVLMGPIQGAIVNWCGHKYGYSNHNNGDHSKNSSPWGILLMGELFQNNHHYHKESPNFAMRWFEFDTTYLVMRLFNAVGIIKLLPVRAPAQKVVQSSSSSVLPERMKASA